MTTKRAWIAAAGWMLAMTAPLLAQNADPAHAYPIMRPDWATVQAWARASRMAEPARLDPRLPLRAEVNLVNYLTYTPAERNQLSCGNCWSWAGTGVMEIGLAVQNGTYDRLSVQFLCTCGGKPACGCQGGWLQDVVDFFNAKGYTVPWANPEASFLNGNGQCYNTCTDIGTSPNYPVTAIAMQTIATQGQGQQQAISNIKNILNQNKAIWFGFFMPQETYWTQFQTYWGNQAETAVWNSDIIPQGAAWDAGGGGHAILCVGYNDTVAEPYWIMVNSWGTAAGNRPDGILRWKMNIDYSRQSSYQGSLEYNLFWQTLNVTYGTSAKPVVTTETATAITDVGATLRGSVNPKGQSTTYYFQYGITADYTATTPTGNAGAGSTAQAVSAAISSLAAAQTYHYRIVAQNSAGASYGVDRTFTTTGGGPVPPDVTTGDALDIGLTNATLTGTINPRGQATTNYFEYGLTTSYYSHTTPRQSVGAGGADVAVTSRVAGLTPGATYHYRLVGQSATRTAFGLDRTFTVAAPSDILLSEGFEHGGSWPAGWDQQYITPDSWSFYVDWEFQSGGIWGMFPESAHSGSYNAFFQDYDYGAATAMITPALNFGTNKQVLLTFWHCMQEDFWYGDQDYLYIYTSPNPADPNGWTEQAAFLANVSDWTKRTVVLTNAPGTQYIAFDGISYYGYGVAIDDVEVRTGTMPTPTPTPTSTPTSTPTPTPTPTATRTPTPMPTSDFPWELFPIKKKK